MNLWGPQSLECREGDRVRIVNGFTRKNTGRFELNINSVDDIEVLG